MGWSKLSITKVWTNELQDGDQRVQSCKLQINFIRAVVQWNAHVASQKVATCKPTRRPASCELLDNELLVASQRVANFDPTNCKVQANKLWVTSQQVASVPHCEPACWKRKGQRVTNLQIYQLQVCKLTIRVG